MHVIYAYDTDRALEAGLKHLTRSGVEQKSRNGPVLRSATPVTTVFADPVGGRVIFNPVRDANPVFHLMEAIWMLAGRSYVDWLLPFNSQFGQFAETGGRMHGAYGYRWRSAFDHDQITAAVRLLVENPDSRQVVIQMWDANRDLDAHKKDIPCNTHIYFGARNGILDMTVCNRSNDVVWGAYGSNVVHFSMLQELIALAAGLRVGFYYQMSNNYHVYSERPDVVALLGELNDQDSEAFDWRPHDLAYVPMLHPGEKLEDFLDDCEKLTFKLPASAVDSSGWNTAFFHKVVLPLMTAYIARKEGSTNYETFFSSTVDWHAAFHQWVTRRNQRKEMA